MRWAGVVCAVVLLLAGCGGGGGGDGDGDEPLERAALNLMGTWQTTETDCESFSADLPAPPLAELDGQFEHEALESPGIRIGQQDNDLVFTALDSGRQWDGTISGDHIRYVYSERRELGGYDIDLFVEAEGTAFDAQHIVVTRELDWSFTVGGRVVSGDTLCTVRLEWSGAQAADVPLGALVGLADAEETDE